MDLSIVRNFTRDLPADRGMALIELCHRLRGELPSHAKVLTESDYFQLAKTVERFIQRYGFIQNMSVRQPDELWSDHLKYLMDRVSDFEPVYIEQKLSADVDIFLGELEEDLKKETEFGETVLSSEDKTEIHGHLQVIREFIQNSKIPEKKKNSLLKQINSLAAEVDRYGTKSDGFFGFIIELSVMAKKFHENLSPAIEDVHKILKTLYQRKAKNEGIELPKPDEMPQLPSPEDFE